MKSPMILLWKGTSGPVAPPSWKGRGQYPVLRRPWPSETLFC